ncbi:MAG TPA: energy transducer TonB [Gemmatimonadales bacterium]|nr:energy transducer TonB [Gemmatimonadales bacterium]
MLRRLALATSLIVAPALAAQNRADGFIAIARAHITAKQFDQADSALSTALDAAGYLMDSVHVYVWRAILGGLRGSDSLAHVNFRTALQLYPSLRVNGLDRLSPALVDVFESEARRYKVYGDSDVDQRAAWASGPKFAYPPALLPRRVGGHAIVRAVIDTLGEAEGTGLQVLESPDSAFDQPLRQMVFNAQFTPARRKGQVVRSVVTLGFDLQPPPPMSPTQLINAARDQLRARHADSALALTRQALDTASQATPGERVYGLLVQGVAYHAKQRDSLAAVSLDAGLAGYRDLTARGIDLAPFLRRLADSIRLSRPRRGTEQPAAKPKSSPFGAVAAVEPVDEQPVLVSYPPIRYAPEMQALRIGGTVIVEATLDTTGHVRSATLKIVQSPNPVFNAEAKRVVGAAVYRPARFNGKPARVTIRQAITFAAY